MASSKIRGITIELNADTAGIMDGLKDVNKSLGATDKALKDVQKLLRFDDSNTELLTQQQKYLQQAIEECSTKLEKEKELLSSLQNADNADQTVEQQQALARQIAETEQKLNGYKNSLAQASGELDDYTDETEVASTATLNLGDVIKANLTSVAIISGIKALADGIKEVTAAAFDVGSSFESAMSQVAATMGMTSDDVQNNIKEYELLSNAAKEMGKATMFSATEAAEALNYLALAGYDAEKAAETLPKVLTLAAAGGMDLAYASDLITDSMAAMGMETSELDNYLDEMARTSQKSNTSVSQLGEATLVCAGAVSLTGQSLETMNVELGLLANNGIKGAEGGTHLRNVLLSLSAPTEKAAAKLDELGIVVADSNGNMRDLNSIMKDLNKSLDGMGSVEKAAAIKTIFNKTDIAAVNALLKGTNEEYEALEEQLLNCAGAAEDMADTMQDNLQGKITILKSALEGLGISFFEVFDDDAKTAVDSATNAVGRLQDALENGDLGLSVQKLSDSFGELMQKLVSFAEEALPGVIDGATWLIDNLDTITALVKTLAGAYVAYEVAAIAAKVATEGFTLALSMNPIGAIAAAVVGLTVATVEMAKSLHSGTEEIAAMNEEFDRNAEVIRNSVQEALKADKIEGLTNKIMALNKQASVSGDDFAKLTKYVEEYNSIVDASNQIVVDSTGHIQDLSEANMELVEVQAQLEDAIIQLNGAQDEFDNASKKQEKNLEKRKEIEEEYADRLIITASIYDEYKAELDAVNAEIDDSTQKMAGAKENLAIYGEEVTNCQNALAELQAAQEAEAAESEAQAQAIEALTEDLTDMQDAIASSIQSSLDLTKAWSQEWETSTSQMTGNIQSQIEGINNWAENFDVLANASDVAINQEVLQYLANLGTEGAGLIQELVDTLNESPEELQDWADSMAEYLKLDDEVAQEMIESYTTAITGISEESAATVEETMPQVQDAFLAGYELQELDAEGHKTLMVETATKMMTDMTQAVTDGTEPLKATVNTLMIESLKSAYLAIGMDPENAESRAMKFFNLGMNVDQSIADGITENQALIATALQTAFDTAIDGISLSGLSSKINKALGQAMNG